MSRQGSLLPCNGAMLGGHVLESGVLAAVWMLFALFDPLALGQLSIREPCVIFEHISTLPNQPVTSNYVIG